MNAHSKRPAYLPFAALTLLALFWGYNWVVMKVAVQYSDPFTFAALRNVLGAVALFAVVAVRRGSFRPKAFWWTVLFGFFQTSLSGLAMWALYLGSAGRTSVLSYTMPFWVLVIAWPVLGERIRGTQWAAVVLALAGLGFIIDPWELRGLGATLLALAGGLCWAIGSVLFKVIRKRHDVELVSFAAWQTLLGSIPLVVVAFIVDDTGPVWTGSFIAALLYNVIPASAIAYLLWLYVLHSMPAGTAGISTLAVPVVGVVAAWIQLHERPGTMEAVGMGLIVVGLAILTARGIRENRKERLAGAASPETPTSKPTSPKATAG
jgi:drug/metabolite transporter (DMT)-like permease